jgi:peptidoglycan/LPS O-acetylase OafA/YrhL
LAIQNNIKFKKPYFENLDALRFLAAFAVFAFHFFSEANAMFHFDDYLKLFKITNLIISKGTLGVNFFFVLSGFLITYLILNERAETNHFNVKNFLVRRTLRIWPLYFLIVIIGFIVFPILIDGYSTNHSGWHYAFFLANFDEIKVGLTDPINFLTAPWSVAVEEQFYLFWGLVLFTLHKMNQFNLYSLLTLLWLGSLVFTFINLDDARVLYYHTFSVMSNILIGSALAVAFFRKELWLEKFKQLRKVQILSIYLFGIVLILFKNKLFIGILSIFEQSVISFFFAFVIFDQIACKNSFLKIGKIQLFNHLGKISYGLYLYHLLVIYIILQFGGTFLESASTALGVTLFLGSSTLGTYIISYLSFNYFEKPFLSLKRKFY